MGNIKREGNKVKEKISPNHRMGKYTGYELVRGEYHIAPTYTDSFTRLSDRRISTDTFMQSIVKYVTEINKGIACEQRKLWEQIYEDLGLDRTKRWTFNYATGTISIVKKRRKDCQLK